MRNLIAFLWTLLCIGGIVSCQDGKLKSSKSPNNTIVGVQENDDTLQNLQTNKDSGTNNKGLNEIRFAHFEDKDWLDNDYIRCLRKYLDDYLCGKIEDDGLEPYKGIIQGKFVLGDTEPFILGGLFIRFIFVDSPNNMFSAWVYSDVDEDREVVTGYSVRAIKLEDDNSGFTKNRILELVKEHPELKLW